MDQVDSMLISEKNMNRFGDQTADLRSGIVKCTMKVVSTVCKNMDAITAYRLIPLDKKSRCKSKDI